MPSSGDGDASSVSLRPDFEYGVLAVDDGLVVDGQRLEVSEIGYLGAGRDSFDRPWRTWRARPAARGLLLGGEPFAEELVMWWNFIGSTTRRSSSFRRLWNDEDELFGRVVGYDGDRLLAPPMPATRLKSRPRHR